MKPLPLLIDCDPGTDDAVALLLAFAAPEAFDVRAVTTVGGNVPLDLTTSNARRIVELAGRRDVPVAAGCPGPILRRLETAAHVHGEDGLAGAALPPPTLPAAAAHGVDLIIDAARRIDGLTLAVTGPMTNLAVALVKAPDIARRIDAVVFMGGAFGAGNATPHAEFNVYVDPHAAAVVLGSGIPLTMIGLDVTRQVLATPGRTAAIQAKPVPPAQAVAAMLAHGLRRTGGAGAAMHDPCVIARLMRPALFGGRPARVAVETEDPVTLGRTSVDWADPQPNCTVLDTVDADGFFALLMERLARL
jgi:purine nucleosidase